MSSSSPKKRQNTQPQQTRKRTKKTNTDALIPGIALPVDIVAANSTTDIINILEQISEAEENDDWKYPVLIGSRAAAFWLPSFNASDDWELVATPKQTLTIIKDLQAYSSEQYNQLKISLHRQPLDLSIIKNRDDAILNSLPEYLYTICGSIKGNFTFNIEIAPVNSQSRDRSSMEESALMPQSSWLQLLKLCNTSNEENQTYFSFPLDPNTSHTCVATGIMELEAILCCGMHCETDFKKRMTDMHSLRYLMASTSINIGIRAAKDKPLGSPERSQEVQAFMDTLTLEMEGYLGTPTDVSNVDTFICENAQSNIIQHSELHNLVKYHDISIVDKLKHSRTKQVITKTSFQEATYQDQLECIKEEVMVNALDHFLIPGYSDDTQDAYISSLAYLCNHAAKGLFKEFIINNYPRLDTCDKDLTTIKDDILSTHPSTSTEQDVSSSILKNSAFELCDFNIIKQLIALTKETTLRSIGQRVSRLKKKQQQENPEEAEAPQTTTRQGRRGGKNYAGPYSFNKSSENFWTIDSSLPNKDPLIIGFVNHYKFGQENYMDPEYTYNGAICVLPLNAHADTKALKDYRPRTGRWYGSASYPEDSFAKIGLSSIASCSTEDWNGEDVWSHAGVQANTLTNEVGQLGIKGLTQDLFMLYLLALANPCLSGSGEDPFEKNVDDAKCRGVLPLVPKHHLWYDLWRLHVQK